MGIFIEGKKYAFLRQLFQEPNLYLFRKDFPRTKYGFLKKVYQGPKLDFKEGGFSGIFV